LAQDQERIRIVRPHHIGRRRSPVLARNTITLVSPAVPDLLEKPC